MSKRRKGGPWTVSMTRMRPLGGPQNKKGVSVEQKDNRRPLNGKHDKKADPWRPAEQKGGP